MAVFYCLLIAGVGLIVFLLSAVWEQELFKRISRCLSDTRAESGVELEELLRDRAVIEWVRVLGAIGLLVGLVLPMFLDR